MNGNNYLIDTNIVLYLLGGDKTLIPILDDKNLYISFINAPLVTADKDFKKLEEDLELIFYQK